MIGKTEIARYEPGDYQPPKSAGELAAHEYLSRRRSLGPAPKPLPRGLVVAGVLMLFVAALALVFDGDGCDRAPVEMKAS